jgi:hypothetical protein
LDSSGWESEYSILRIEVFSEYFLFVIYKFIYKTGKNSDLAPSSGGTRRSLLTRIIVSGGVVILPAS